MPVMPPQDDATELAQVGRRLKRKVQLALALCIAEYDDSFVVANNGSADSNWRIIATQNGFGDEWFGRSCLGPRSWQRAECQREQNQNIN